jgi:hypothetical protein
METMWDWYGVAMGYLPSITLTDIGSCDQTRRIYIAPEK